MIILAPTDLCFTLQEAMVPRSSVLRRWEKKTGFPEVTRGEFAQTTTEPTAYWLLEWTPEENKSDVKLNYSVLFYFTSPASTGWTCRPTRATSNWRRSWCLPLRRQKASGRSERNQEKFKIVGAGVWRNKDHQCSNQGASSEKAGVFVCFVLMHARTHLYGTSMGACVRPLPACCCKGAEILRLPRTPRSQQASRCLIGMWKNVLYSFKPKHRSCSCLLECAANYAWDPENSPSTTSV